MFGSGENTVAPTSILPSRSFCFAVLYIRVGAFCCCASSGAALKKSAQDRAIQVVASEERFLAIGFSLRRSNSPDAPQSYYSAFLLECGSRLLSVKRNLSCILASSLKNSFRCVIAGSLYCSRFYHLPIHFHPKVIPYESV